MLAETTIDLGSIIPMIKNLGVPILLLICLGTFVMPLLVDLWNVLRERAVSGNLPITPDGLKRKDTNRSSDQAPPAGFATHLQIIEDTAPNASADVWWKYAKAEMTEAEVAIAEAKLARKEEKPQSV